MIDRHEKDEDGEFVRRNSFIQTEGLKRIYKILRWKYENLLMKDVIAFEGEKNGVPVEVAMIYNTSYS